MYQAIKGGTMKLIDVVYDGMFIHPERTFGKLKTISERIGKRLEMYTAYKVIKILWVSISVLLLIGIGFYYINLWINRMVGL
jgi:hypothetical protein